MKSIKLRLMVSLGLLLAFVCAVFGGIAYYMAYSSLKEDVQNTLPQISQQAVQILESRLESNFDALETIAEMDVIQDPSEPIIKKVEVLTDQLNTKSFATLSFIDTEGNLYTKTGTTTLNLKERDYVQNALKGNRFVTDPFAAKNNGGMKLVFSVPIKHADKIIGVLAGYQDANILSSLIKDITYGKSGSAFMVNKNGVIIAHRNKDYVIQMVNNIDKAKKFPKLNGLAEIEADMTSGKVGISSYTDWDIVKTAEEEEKEEAAAAAASASSAAASTSAASTSSTAAPASASGAAAPAAASSSTAPASTSDNGIVKIPDEKLIAEKGVEKFIAYAPVKTTAWSLAVTAPKAEVYESLKNLALIITIVTLLVLAISIAVAFFIASRISNPLRYAAQQLQRVASGDFTQETSQKYLKMKDEIGLLANSIDSMQISLKDLIGGVKDSSNDMVNMIAHVDKNMANLNESITGISATTEQLSAGMEETAASSEEINATTAEIESAVDSIAKKAQEGVVTADQINTKANELRKNAYESQQQADSIYMETQSKLKNAIEQSRAVEQIGSLSEAILQITSQTNLLALNAAIEAARAGEAGKGFAVVADEIRKLAEDSKNTVNKIQSVTKTVIESVENLSANSENVLEFIDRQVIKDYQEMVQIGEQYSKDAAFVDEIMGDFSATTQQLTAAIQNMSRAVSEISISANEGAEGTMQIAKESGDILNKSHRINEDTKNVKANADKLLDMVKQFKV